MSMTLLPQWHRNALADVRSEADVMPVSRRSGGLPFLIKALMPPRETVKEKDHQFFPLKVTVNFLMNQIRESTRDSHMRIHCYHILASLLRDHRNAKGIGMFLSDLIKLPFSVDAGTSYLALMPPRETVKEKDHQFFPLKVTVNFLMNQIRESTRDSHIRIHCYHILASLLRDHRNAKGIGMFLSDLIKLPFSVDAGTSYLEENATNLFLRALIPRIFGQGEDKTMTAKAFLEEFDVSGLFQRFLDNPGNKPRSHLYTTLLLLAKIRATPSTLEFMEPFRPLLLRTMQHDEHGIRVAAFEALVCTYLPGDYDLMLLDTLRLLQRKETSVNFQAAALTGMTKFLDENSEILRDPGSKEHIAGCVQEKLDSLFGLNDVVGWALLHLVASLTAYTGVKFSFKSRIPDTKSRSFQCAYFSAIVLNCETQDVEGIIEDFLTKCEADVDSLLLAFSVFSQRHVVEVRNYYVGIPLFRKDFTPSIPFLIKIFQDNFLSVPKVGLASCVLALRDLQEPSPELHKMVQTWINESKYSVNYRAAAVVVAASNHWLHLAPFRTAATLLVDQDLSDDIKFALSSTFSDIVKHSTDRLSAWYEAKMLCDLLVQLVDEDRSFWAVLEGHGSEVLFHVLIHLAEALHATPLGFVPAPLRSRPMTAPLSTAPPRSIQIPCRRIPDTQSRSFQCAYFSALVLNCETQDVEGIIEDFLSKCEADVDSLHLAFSVFSQRHVVEVRNYYVGIPLFRKDFTPSIPFLIKIFKDNFLSVPKVGLASCVLALRDLQEPSPELHKMVQRWINESKYSVNYRAAAVVVAASNHWFHLAPFRTAATLLVDQDLSDDIKFALSSTFSDIVNHSTDRLSAWYEAKMLCDLLVQLVDEDRSFWAVLEGHGSEVLFHVLIHLAEALDATPDRGLFPSEMDRGALGMTFHRVLCHVQKKQWSPTSIKRKWPTENLHSDKFWHRAALPPKTKTAKRADHVEPVLSTPKTTTKKLTERISVCETTSPIPINDLSANIVELQCEFPCNVIIEANVSISLTHTFTADLAAEAMPALEAHRPLSKMLWRDTTCLLDEIDANFSDSATQSLEDSCSVPAVGDFKPVQELNGWAGLPACDNFRVIVYDFVGGDRGEMQRVAISVLTEE
ncbi:unnamed protein product [Cyprideis torosa]|uniref:DUF2428 domain-containing protein n=1 Tax=Cyprideis torosa TaxID=163714 RepID=A0A7R8WKI0_9CRUS|nr:unnamed protein product [Cyprideis torosa]CAG0896127.1 unnamed protein product [Cyprideis torosa]